MEIQKDIHVVRFKNEDIIDNIESVLSKLNKTLQLFKSKKS
jgi:very-short-patch-repair endonuclease